MKFKNSSRNPYGSQHCHAEHIRSAQCKLREASRCPARQTLRCAQSDSGEADKSAPTVDFVYLHQRHFNMPKVYTTLITKSSKNVQSRGGKMGFSMANPMRTPFPLRDNLLQLFLHEVDCQRPGLCRGFLIAHTMIRIDERVACIIHFDGEILACRFIHLFNLVHLLHRNTLVPATIKSQHRRIDFRDIFRGWVVSACIEW